MEEIDFELIDPEGRLMFVHDRRAFSTESGSEYSGFVAYHIGGHNKSEVIDRALKAGCVKRPKVLPCPACGGTVKRTMMLDGGNVMLCDCGYSSPKSWPGDGPGSDSVSKHNDLARAVAKGKQS